MSNSERARCTSSRFERHRNRRRPSRTSRSSRTILVLPTARPPGATSTMSSIDPKWCMGQPNIGVLISRQRAADLWHTGWHAHANRPRRDLGARPRHGHRDLHEARLQRLPGRRASRAGHAQRDQPERGRLPGTAERARPRRVPGGDSARRPGGGLIDFIAAGGGLRYVVVASDDLAADVAAMRGRGVDVSDAMDGSRRTESGLELSWRVAALGPRHPLPVVFIQHLTPREVRRRQVPAVGNHPNGVQRIDRVYVATTDVRAEAEIYARVLGMPVPKIQRGTVIMADMAVFDLGPTGLSVAQPYAPGPAADALARRGPGPFQVLYRTSSMGGGGPLDARSCGAAARPRRPQHRRAGDAGASRARLRRLHRPGRSGVRRRSGGRRAPS